MTTLALDLGQNLGWVRGSAVGQLDYGTFPMKETTDLGLWLQQSDPFFMNILNGIDDVAVEQPFLSSGGKKKDGSSRPGGYYPARKLLGLLGHLYYHARVKGIPGSKVNEIPVSTGKLALSGHGNAEASEMIEAACRFHGWEPDDIDEHIAHAAGIFHVHIFGEAPPRRKRARSSPGRSILRVRAS